MINYNGKIFSPANNKTGGDFSTETFFVFRQTGNILSSNYSGENIVRGQVLTIVGNDGSMEMNYQHVTTQLVLIAGSGKFIPELLPNGKIMLNEKRKLVDGDFVQGDLIIEH
ncbi:hypothetical protein QWZ08_01080 [Ferruginibacter paludis]|uniref:hypothetical protein n=1 Tax=Ferruginibacter paludis TaxID=1310417 RepID=UPI0025B619FA|nr:hypothetical protein [Ferruginibacter paludis]MDN3654195.1 hypothetical protein [Ferruginibacter paludis]